eukprot:3931923-Rhodomonas_salina.1
MSGTDVGDAATIHVLSWHSAATRRAVLSLRMMRTAVCSTGMTLAVLLPRTGAGYCATRRVVLTQAATTRAVLTQYAATRSAAASPSCLPAGSSAHA